MWRELPCGGQIVQSTSNYLNESEAVERLSLNRACIRRFGKFGWLSLAWTTTGFLVLRRSIERLESHEPSRLAYAQLHCRKVDERARLKASQRTLEL